MKKLLIVLLLSLTTIFTQVSASGFYLEFDGVNDYVQIPPNSSINIQDNDFEFEIEFRTTKTGTFPIFWLYDTSGQFGFVRFETANGYIRVLLNNGSTTYNLNSTTLPNDGNWTNLKLSRNNNTVSLIINDNVEDTVSVTGSFSSTSNNGIVLGWRTTLEFALFEGDMRYFKININNQDVSEYLFDEGSGTTLNDNIGNNDGTIVGATWGGSAPAIYPLDVNLDSNYGDYFDEDIQFQSQNVLLDTYPISAQLVDVNDDWVADAPTSNIGSFTFQHWFDLDNNTIFTTDSDIDTFLDQITIDRDFNLRAIYSGVTEYQVDLEMESGLFDNIAYQGNSFNNNAVTQFDYYIQQTVPDGTEWQAVAPNVAGQNFDGWFDLDSNVFFSTNESIQVSSTTRDYDLEARYSTTPTYSFNAASDLPSPPDFTYQVNNETPENDYPVNITLDEGDDIQITAPTSGIGFYEFDGWYDTLGQVLLTNNSTLSISNVQNILAVEARYTLPEEYEIDLTLTSQIGNIQFQIDAETPIFAPTISETLFEGQSFQATAPSDPTNYEFQHWFDLDNNVVFSTNLFITAQDVDQDYNLQAQYLEIFDITFDSQGGTAFNPDTALDGEEYTLPIPTREGFAFQGWIDGNEPLPAPIAESPYTITQDTEFIAQWVAIITVSFNSNGGTFVPPQSITAGGLVTAPAIPSRFGYLFEGWYLDNNTFANEFDFNSPISFAPEDFTLHAEWVLGSDSDFNQTIDDWITNSGVSSMFIMLVILVALSITLGAINAQMFVIVISNLSIVFVFTALGFIPLWVLLIAGLAVIGFIGMAIFGGGSSD